MTAQRVRVRYAPSPTGLQHIGGVRTALFNYLYARSKGGEFILRVEDTDRERSQTVYEEDLYRQLSWLGLSWDEGPAQGGPYAPYRQSERIERHRAAVRRLLDESRAYCCYCTPEELRVEREQALAEGRPPRYSGRCRSPRAREALAKEGRPPAVRFRVPEGETIAFRDLVRGEVSFRSDDMGDFVIYRADDESLENGRALYNLAAVVDDAAMGISDVLRGEEHLSNTPRQIMLYRALDLEPPRFGHLSLIVSPEGSKLSKRYGDTSIAHYREVGYLPEALVAYLATLGWAPGRHPERMGLADLISLFDIRRLSSNPATFDSDRLLWFNRRRLQSADLDYLGPLVRPRLERVYGAWHHAQGTAHEPQEWFELLLAAAQEEAQTLGELVSLCCFALADGDLSVDAEARDALEEPGATRVLSRLRERLVPGAVDSQGAAHALLQGLREELADLSGRAVMFPIRAALTGSLSGPSLAVVMTLLGNERCLRRVEAAL